MSKRFSCKRCRDTGRCELLVKPKGHRYPFWSSDQPCPDCARPEPAVIIDFELAVKIRRAA